MFSKHPPKHPQICGCSCKKMLKYAAMGRIVHNNLTDLKVKRAVCPPEVKSLDLRDGEGLILRISGSGNKNWRYEYRYGNDKKVLPLGSYPHVSLKHARDLSQNARTLRKNGIDPFEHARQAVLVAEQEQLRKAAMLDEERAEPMFEKLVEEYLTTLEGATSRYNVKCALYKDAVPKWKDRKAKSITRRECVILLDEVKARAPVQANRLYSFLQTLFKVGIRRGLVDSNPMADVAKPAPKADQRDNSGKALSCDEIQMLFGNLGSNPFDDVIRLMLWTGARPKEILGMKWRQIQDDIWTLGAGEHKAGHRCARVISRPLIKPAVEIINKYSGCHEELVFPGRKRVAMNTSSLNQFITRKRNHYTIEGFTAHHIRHTMSTKMREIGVRPDLVERILGHIVDVGVVGVYSSYNWLPEMREGLEKWNHWIDDLIVK